MVLPELITARLTLRPWRLEDVDRLHELWTNPHVRRYLWDDVVISRQRALETVAASIQNAQERGIGMWTLWQRQDPALAGFCGLRQEEDVGEIELLYGLAPAYWGRGLATEAAQAVIAHVLRFNLAEVVLARTDAPNTASIRVLERLGMLRQPDRDGLVCYGLQLPQIKIHKHTIQNQSR